MKKLILLSTLVMSSSTYSQVVSELGPLYLLTEDVRDVITHKEAEIIPPPSEALTLTTDQSDIMSSITALDKELLSFSLDDKDCDCHQPEAEKNARAKLFERIEDRDYNVYVAATYGAYKDPMSLMPAGYDLQRLNGYLGSQAALADLGLTSLDALKNAYKQKNPDVALDSLSLVEQGNLLGQFAQEKGGTAIPQSLLLGELAINKSIQDPTKWKETLGSISSALSFEDKYKVAAQFGSYFGSNYNYDRANSGKGIIGLEQLLGSARDNTPGGVCRDIALGNSKILMAMGIPKDKIMIIGYATYGGGHAVLAVEDPNKKGRVMILNYGQVQEVTGKSGPSVLVQNTRLPDAGIQYRMYDSEGKPVGSQHSELGLMLREATNAQAPLLTTQGMNLVQVGVKTPIGDGNMFMGNTSDGGKITGVAIDKRFESGSITSEIGLAGFKRESNRALADLTQEGLYMRLGIEQRSPTLFLNDQTGIRVRGGLDSDGLITRNKEVTSTGRVEKSTTIESKAELYMAVDIEHKSDDGKTRAYATIEPRVQPDFTNVASGEKLRPVLAETRITSGVERRITEDMRASVDAGIIVRQMGNSYYLKTGLEIPDEKFRLNASMQGPIGDVPVMYRGSTRAVAASAEKDFGRASFRLVYEQDLDTGARSGKAALKIPLGKKRN